MIVCEEKKWVGGKRERIIFYIMLLGSLYYFIGLYVLKKKKKQRCRDVGWIVKWVSKIDKVVFENAKLLLLLFIYWHHLC